jgi:S-formylglutathione hydrolase FrmB
MILSELRFPSRTLGLRVSMNVLLPENLDGPFATFYLLHGLSDDHTGWQRWTRIENYAGNLPLAIVMPQGFRGFYTNNNAGPRYLDYIVEDVIGAAERYLPLKRERGSRCIGGLSMGGYGALRVGLARPDLFASINSHSGALLAGTTGQRKDGPMPTPEWMSIFGHEPAGSEHDLVTLAKRVHAGAMKPQILIDCGENDFLIDQNRGFESELKKIGLPHTYREFPGVHDWNYWDLHIRDALAFHAQAIGINPPTPRE